MSREDVIRLAREIGLVGYGVDLCAFYDAAFKAGQEAEQEAIMHECIPGGSFCDPQQICDAIRARGEKV